MWEYSDSGAELNGAVNLPDDSTLLCGKDYESTSKGQIYYGFLVHLDLSGKELSKDHWYPTTDQTYKISQFSTCLRWADGVALVGGVSSSGGSLGWLIKLNDQGVKEWEKLGPDVGELDAIETQEHDLVMVAKDPGGHPGKQIIRLDQTGVVIGQRKVASDFFSLVRFVVPSTNAYLIVLEGAQSHLLTLDRQLHDAIPPQTFHSISVVDRQGRAYLYADRSLALFGNASLPGNMSTAAIAHIDPQSKQNGVYLFPQSGESSAWISDAVQLSPSLFVTVRQLVTPQNTARTGIVLDWVSIK